jgi:hypothetical protein
MTGTASERVASPVPLRSPELMGLHRKVSSYALRNVNNPKLADVDCTAGEACDVSMSALSIHALARFSSAPQSLICPSWQETYFSPAQNFSLNA